MSGRLQGKVALISGTARGQGAEAKARFEAEGADRRRRRRSDR